LWDLVNFEVAEFTGVVLSFVVSRNIGDKLLEQKMNLNFYWNRWEMPFAFTKWNGEWTTIRTQVSSMG